MSEKRKTNLIFFFWRKQRNHPSTDNCSLFGILASDNITNWIIDVLKNLLVEFGRMWPLSCRNIRNFGRWTMYVTITGLWSNIVCMQRRICVCFFFNKMAVVTVRDPFHNKVTFLVHLRSHHHPMCVHTFRTNIKTHTYAYTNSEHTRRREGKCGRDKYFMYTYDIGYTFYILYLEHTHEHRHEMDLNSLAS